MVLDTKEHRQEMIKDWHGNAHPILNPSRQHTLWARILSSVAFEAYLDVEIYTKLANQAKALAALQKMYADSILPSRDLPEDYAASLLKFRHYLDRAVCGPMGKLKYVAVASPPLRRFHVRQPPEDSSSTIIDVERNINVKANKVETKLIWLLRTLWEDGYQLFLAGLPLVVDELQRLVQSEPQAKDLISESMADLMGEFSTLAQCIKELELYNPWARTWESDAADGVDDLKNEFAQYAEPRSGLTAGIQASLSEKSRSPEAVTLGEPTTGKFTYPIEK
jgi:hypothetical protein